MGSIDNPRRMHNDMGHRKGVEKLKWRRWRGASQCRRLALIPQPLLPKRAKRSKTFQSPSPHLGEGFRVRVTKVG
jgi:hypothetical protein